MFKASFVASGCLPFGRLPFGRLLFGCLLFGCLLFGCLLFGCLPFGCGARSSVEGHGRPSSPIDGASSPRADARAPLPDARSRRDAATPPLDRGPPDSCIPIPAREVVGQYRGTFAGSVECLGARTPISGELQLDLTPAGSADAFTVDGRMTGQLADFPIRFQTSILGTMTCTALSATMPDLEAGEGIPPLELRLQGTLVGTFSARPRGFPSGSWRITSRPDSPPCTGSGTWSATR